MMWLICYINTRGMFQFSPVNRISDLKLSHWEINFRNRISSFCLESWLPLLESSKIGKLSLKFKINILFDEGVRFLYILQCFSCKEVCSVKGLSFGILPLFLV